MILRSIIFSCLFFVVGMFTASAQIDFSHVDDHNAMVKQAEVYKKPFFIYFTMDICLPCEKMKREVFSDSDISTLANDKYLTYSVNISNYSGKQLGKQHNVAVAPTFIFFDANGNMIEKVEGALSQTNFKKLLVDNATAAVPHTQFSDFR